MTLSWNVNTSLTKQVIFLLCSKWYVTYIDSNTKRIKKRSDEISLLLVQSVFKCNKKQSLAYVLNLKTSFKVIEIKSEKLLYFELKSAHFNLMITKYYFDKLTTMQKIFYRILCINIANLLFNLQNDYCYFDIWQILICVVSYTFGHILKQ